MEGYLVNAKALKALSKWTADPKRHRDQIITRVFWSGGAWYATDTYTAARIEPADAHGLDLPEGTGIDPEVFERMNARDVAVCFTPEGVRLGSATFPYVEPAGRVPMIGRVFEPGKGEGSTTYDADYIARAAALANAAKPEKGKPRMKMQIGGPALIRIATGSGSIQCVIMPVME